MKMLRRASCLGIVLLLILPSISQASGLGGQNEFAQWVQATDQELDSMRGGFVTPDGLVSIGIENATYFNGQLQAVTDLSSPTVIQNGQGNGFSPAAVGNYVPGGFTLIQNSLDNQLIQHVTTINATVANVNLFRQMNISSMLHQQMVNLMR